MYQNLEIYLEIAKFDIKHNKKAISAFSVLTVFNICFLIFDFYNGLHGSMIASIATGAMLMNFLYSLIKIIEYINEYKESKKILSFYRYMQARKNLTELNEHA